jgi:hypothetical protein
MEQFLRVSISYGLAHYQAGLDHCRAELVNENLVARKNRGSDELRRPSLRHRSLTFADLEAYHSLVAGKLPLLMYLRDLVVGLAEVSRPLTDPLTSPLLQQQVNGVAGAIEWKYSESTLAEARQQYERQVNAIEAGAAVIEASLKGARSDLMLSELTEARKLSEIEAERPRRQTVVLRTGEWEKLTLRLTVLALILGAFEIYTSFGVLLTNRLLSGTPLPSPFTWLNAVGVAHWLLPVGAGLLLYAFLRRQARSGAPTDDDGPNDRQETHVFDYSFLRETVTADGRSSKVIQQLRDGMIDLEEPGRRTACVSYSTFRETPSTGVQLVKHSLESGTSRHGFSYILHLEVDLRLGRQGTERLRDIRLVVRRGLDGNGSHEDLRGFDIDKAAQRVIRSCVKDLVLTNQTDDQVREFFEQRFSWVSVSE